MVLQRDTKLNIWGWAKAGEKVNISFNGKKYKATTDKEGNWKVQLAPTKAGGPYTMDIKASNQITLKDILIGDVWMCAGQSNMVIPMERVKEKYPDEIATANNSQIRHFFIPTYTDLQKPWVDLPTGYWKSAVKGDILQFSAVAYFFAKKIYEKYQVPIGLVNASVGGTLIEAWISEEGLKDFPQLTATIQKMKDTAYVNSTNRAAFAAIGTRNRPTETSDLGLAGPIKWFDQNYVPKAWHKYYIPGYWADQGVRGLNGVVWFRKEIDVPASMTGVPAKLFMGRIIDADHVYINGKLVGNITYQYPPRRYEVPADLLKPGKNSIVVRVQNQAGKGGFVPDKSYYLTANGQNIDLKGEWLYKVGEVYTPRSFGGGGGGGPISAQSQPTSLYNAMVGPLINYNVKGFLWYQGEANSGKPAEYAQLLPALIADWRSKFNVPNAPFLFVQLPNFMDVQYTPSESQWAVLRESQLKSLSVPNTAMAVAIDAGEWNDIHPLNKKDVGERLALAAKKLAYGENDIVWSGPLYRSARVDGNKIVITFDNVGSGLTTNDGEPPAQFAIAGADKKFVWAKAVIRDNTIEVWSDEISNPAFVRYAWADNPDGANLYNKEGLPASPFRTDQ
jgi:sialate O-acetylesterase